jgi:two-component system, response regulator PdtaR
LMRQAAQAKVYSVIPKPISKNLVLYTVVRALSRFYGGNPPPD